MSCFMGFRNWGDRAVIATVIARTIAELVGDALRAKLLAGE